MSGKEGAPSGGSHELAAKGLAGNAAKASVPMDINAVFGRNADALNTLMHGHDVALAHSMAEIIESLKSHTTNNSSGGGEGGGGGTNVSVADLGAHSGPILNTTASQQSMVDLVGGKNAEKGHSSGGGGGWSLGG